MTASNNAQNPRKSLRPKGLLLYEPRRRRAAVDDHIEGVGADVAGYTRFRPSIRVPAQGPADLPEREE
jgi:hypothetical protein